MITSNTIWIQKLNGSLSVVLLKEHDIIPMYVRIHNTEQEYFEILKSKLLKWMCSFSQKCTHTYVRIQVHGFIVKQVHIRSEWLFTEVAYCWQDNVY